MVLKSFSIPDRFVVGAVSSLDGPKMDELEQQSGSRLRPTLFVLPSPAILVGYAA